MITIGDVLPNLTLPATGNQKIHLPSLAGRPLILYFYPKDDTPGCTQEGQDFRDYYNTFQSLNTLILGVSRDRVEKHEEFKATYQFPFDLLSDQEGQLSQWFEVLKPQNWFGKEVMSIERSSFWFDHHGKLKQEWRNVKVPGHVKQLLETIRQ